MRHRRKSKHFDRKTTAWKALFRGFIINVVEHGRITTTVERAKELRRHVEKAITLGKKNDLAARRLLLSRIPHKPTVDAIMKDIAPRFSTRNGGYTRIIKIGRRPGDTAEMAFIEFVDHDWEKASKAAPETKAKAKGKVKADAAVAEKKAAGKKQEKKAKAEAKA